MIQFCYMVENKQKLQILFNGDIADHEKQHKIHWRLMKNGTEIKPNHFLRRH